VIVKVVACAASKTVRSSAIVAATSSTVLCKGGAASGARSAAVVCVQGSVLLKRLRHLLRLSNMMHVIMRHVQTAMHECSVALQLSCRAASAADS
jgi:hypothetical protein